MSALILYYDRCGTCRKALKWMDEKGYAYDKRPIKEENPSREELADWWQKSGQPLKKFFNTSGGAYRELNLKERLPQLSDDEQLDLLAADGMLVKRPLLITDKGVYPGFKEEVWETLLQD